MGHTLTKDGLKPDASKVKAGEEMPPPTDEKGVQRLLGMTNYLQRYAPKLAEVTNPLVRADEERERLHLGRICSWPSTGGDKKNVGNGTSSEIF
jgi:hypothetical protein